MGCRSPYGERGLKLFWTGEGSNESGRSPYGERGLKYTEHLATSGCAASLSLRRAWIEITRGATCK